MPKNEDEAAAAEDEETEETTVEDTAAEDTTAEETAVEETTEEEKGEPTTFSPLSLLYPTLRPPRRASLTGYRPQESDY